MNFEYLIDMHKTTVYRGVNKILDNFSLQIPADRSVAILGPNGAGKTTLLQVLMRELYPLRNQDSYIKIMGKDSWNVWELRRNLGFISQDLQNRYLGFVKGIDVVLSGFHSSVGIYSHQEYDQEKVELAKTIMHNLHIEDLSEKEYSKMSTGEQRRFLLARALVSEPSTLVLDEPTSGMDLSATFQYLRLIRTLMKNGKQIVLVTHHIHEIPPEIGFLVLLKEGRIMASGEKSELLTAGVMSSLYNTPMKIVSENGYFQAIPGH